MAAPEKVPTGVNVVHGLRDFKVVLGPALAPPPREERLKCACGNEHFIVTRVDFTCTVCFKSYRD